MRWLQKLLCMGDPQPRPAATHESSDVLESTKRATDNGTHEEGRSVHDVSVHGEELSGAQHRYLERVTSIPEDHPIMDRPADLRVDSRRLSRAPSSSPHSPSVSIHSTEPSAHDMARRPRSTFALEASAGIIHPPTTSSGGRDLRKRSNDAERVSFSIREPSPSASRLSPGHSPVPKTRRESRGLNSNSRLSIGGGVIEAESIHEILEMQQSQSSFLHPAGPPSNSQMQFVARTSESSSSLSGPKSSSLLRRLRSVNNGLMGARLANSRSVSLALGFGLPPSQEKRKMSRTGLGPSSMPSVVRPRPFTDNYLEDVDDDEGEASGPRLTMDGSNLNLPSLQGSKARVLSSVGLS